MVDESLASADVVSIAIVSALPIDRPVPMDISDSDRDDDPEVPLNSIVQSDSDVDENEEDIDELAQLVDISPINIDIDGAAVGAAGDAAVDAADGDIALAAAIVSDKPNGRPKLQFDLTRQLWGNDVPPTSSTIGHFLTDVFTVLDANNATERVSREVFGLFKKYMPHSIRIPTWGQAETVLVRSCPVQAKHHVACSNDCEVIRKAIEDHSVEELQQLKDQDCSRCGQKFVDAKERWKRVRTD